MAVLAVLVVVGLLGFNYFTTGKITLIPDLSKSDQERALAELDDRLDQAKKQFAQAHRAVALSGVDTTADVEAARKAVQRIGKDLKKLRETIAEDKVKRRAARLAGDVQEFAAQLR